MNILSPSTIQQATRLLNEHDGAIVMAGATDLLVNWPSNLNAHERTYLDISSISELAFHSFSENELVLGALCTYWDIIDDPCAMQHTKLLVDAARTVGAVQIQTRGTWAGNIANASPAADGVAALMALDAQVTLTSATGSQTIPLDTFYLDYKKTRCSHDQLITDIRVPLVRPEFASFVKVGARCAQAITKVGVAIAQTDANWRIVVNSMAPVVKRCAAIEHLLNSQTPVHSPRDFAQAIEADLAPVDDIRSTASYRKAVLARVLYHELAPCCPWFSKNGISKNGINQ